LAYNGVDTVLQVGSSRIRFPLDSLEFLIDIKLLAALWPRSIPSNWQKWIPGIFPGGGGGWWRQPVRKTDKLTTFMYRSS